MVNNARMRFLPAVVWLISALRRVMSDLRWLAGRDDEMAKAGTARHGVESGGDPSRDWARQVGQKASGGHPVCDWLEAGLNSSRWYFRLNPDARGRSCGGGITRAWRSHCRLRLGNFWVKAFQEQKFTHYRKVRYPCCLPLQCPRGLTVDALLVAFCWNGLPQHGGKAA